MTAVAQVGALVGDRTRAALLTMLLDGRARTVGELARAGGVALSTASGHLAKLLDGGLVVVAQDGRHRYYRLAGPRVARALEAMMLVADPPPEPRVPSELRLARTCYDHLAGTLAVDLYARLTVENGEPLPRAWSALGIDLPAAGGRPVVRDCLDWSSRRPHLAGAAGGALLTTLFERGWLTRRRTPRAVRLTTAGRNGLRDALGPGDSWS